jgi:hypothetical protein
MRFTWQPRSGGERGGYCDRLLAGALRCKIRVWGVIVITDSQSAFGTNFLQQARCAMRGFAAIVIVLIAVIAASPAASAKSPEWEKANVIKADFGGSETEAVAVPIPGGTVVGESSTSSGKA